MLVGVAAVAGIVVHSADPFQPGDRAFDRASKSVRLRTYPGAHEGAY